MNSSSDNRTLPTRAFLFWTVPWVTILGLLIVSPFVSRLSPFSYGTYICVRAVCVVVILLLTVLALRRAFFVIGETSTPWYTDGFLLAVVFFWALFPPTWFFAEFLLTEHGQIELYDGSRCNPIEYEKVCKIQLARFKAYADLASKIWAGVGAIFATTIALSKFRSGNSASELS